MLAAALLFLAPAPVASEAPEIVVVAERFNRLTVSVGQDAKGAWHCSLDGSSGVPRLDDRLCRAVTACVRKQARGGKATEDCVQQNRGRLLRKWKREAARR